MSTSENKSWREGLTGYHYLVLVVACLGWSFDTMDQWLYVFVKQHALNELLSPLASGDELKKLVAERMGYVQSCLMLGWACGGLFFGMVGDRLGRTRTMGLTILMYALFTGLSGLAQTWEQFAALRFLTGLGVGGEFAAGAALVAESFPSYSRATALAVVQATSALGNVTAALVNMGMAYYLDPTTAWRWVFAIGIIPAGLVVIIFFFIHEPEAWVASRANLSVTHKKTGSILGLFSEPWLTRNTLVGATLASVGVIGFWGISTFTPELLRGILNPDNSEFLRKKVETQVSLAGLMQNFGAFFGSLVFAYLAQRFGRRPAFRVGLIGCLIVVPATFFLTNSFGTALVLFFAMGFVLLILFGGFLVYFPELFPTRLRATGAGFCYNVARFLAAASPTIFGTLSKNYGIQQAALMVSSVFIIGLIAVQFAPETKDQPLPE